MQNVEVKAALETFMRDLTEFRSTAEANQKTRDGVLEEKMAKQAEEVSKMHEALTLIQTKLNRPAIFSDDPDEEKRERKNHAMFNRVLKATRPQTAGDMDLEAYKAYCAALNRYMRYGEKSLDLVQHKALSIGSDPDGGAWLAPPEIANRITQRVFETTPMREVATVQPISTHEYKIPQDPNSGVSGGWVDETSSRSPTATSQVAMKSITAYEQFAQPQVSQQLLEDGFINVEEWLANKIADIIGRTENTAFVSGTGNAQPRGILTYAAGTNWGQIQQVGTGTSGAFTYAGLINLIVSLKEKYHRNACWLIKRASVGSIMLLQDGNGRYIFQPIVGGNFNNSPLLGYDIRYANDMPAVGAGALAAAFGDFKAGYVIVDRVGMSVLRDNYTAKPNVLFYTRKRTGGDVDDFDAIKLQVLN